MSTGTLAIVGLGPGDPELITRKAARIVAEAEVVAYHAGVRKQSHARRIAADLVPEDVVEEELRYPVTTGTTDHPGGYVGALADFYEQSAGRLRAHLVAGRRVALLAEGDPLFYGSSMYLHDRLAPDFPTDVVPGVPAFAAATAAASIPLVRQADVLTVLSGTLPEAELARRLADTDGAVIMKLGRTFPVVRRALAEAGRLEGAIYVERAAQPEQRWLPAADVDPTSVPYFSLVVVPGDSAAPADTARRLRSGGLEARALTAFAPQPPSPPQPEPSVVEVRAPASLETNPAELLVVGLGPGPEEWLTPEAAEVLADVDHIVGYGPYVARVPQRAGLRRHASGNTVEVDRARFALDLARRGERVAVVSGGDAGVFGMAAAVFEAAADPAHPEHAEVPVRVVPGVSAVQAVAARAGAPIGADFAVMSLSDRLKPWSVIADRLRAVAEADLVLGLYNPASRSRRQQVVDTQKLLLEHRSADTVVIVGRDVGRAEESLTVTTLAALDPETIDMKCLVIVGASTTRVEADGRVWTPRYVEGVDR